MASTRKINSKERHSLYYKGNENILSNRTEEYRTIRNDTVMAELGMNASHIHGKVLASNYCDIESDLYGIGSSNLVQPRLKATPNINTIPVKSFFNRLPMILPEPMVCLKDGKRPKIP